MKTLFNLLILFMFFASAISCKDETENVTPDTTPDYQKAINAKYKELGWTEGADNGGIAQATAAKKGYVQYYGSKNRAIYYFKGQAFSVLNYEMVKYDALGQDNFALISSDYQAISGGGGFIGITKVSDNSEGIIITSPSIGVFTVYGEIYKKYKALNRWSGILGFPTTDEVDLTSKKGRYNGFQKGQIYFGTTTGAQAFWGKLETLYAKTGFDTGWLGLPTTSCDPNVAEGKQYVRFQNGAIDAAPCGNYYNTTGLLRYQNGTTPVGTAIPPCY